MSSIIRYQQSESPYTGLPPNNLLPLVNTYPMIQDGEDKAIYKVECRLTAGQIGNAPWQTKYSPGNEPRKAASASEFKGPVTDFTQGAIPRGALMYVLPEKQVVDKVKVLSFKCSSRIPAINMPLSPDSDNPRSSANNTDFTKVTSSASNENFTNYSLLDNAVFPLSPTTAYFCSFNYMLFNVNNVYCFTVEDTSRMFDFSDGSATSVSILRRGAIIDIEYVLGTVPNSNIGNGWHV